MTASGEGPELDDAIARLIEGNRLSVAERRVAAAVPALQAGLAAALAEGGWFEGPHREQLERAAALDDPAERLTAVSTLLAEETRVSMMIGVTVGWALADELGSRDSPNVPE